MKNYIIKELNRRIKTALRLLYNENMQKVLSSNIKKMGRPHAAENIVKEIISIIR